MTPLDTNQSNSHTVSSKYVIVLFGGETLSSPDILSEPSVYAGEDHNAVGREAHGLSK